MKTEEDEMDPYRGIDDDTLAWLWAMFCEIGDQRRADAILAEIDRRQDADIDEWQRQMAAQV